jgi:hypothetical protein
MQGKAAASRQRAGQRRGEAGVWVGLSTVHLILLLVLLFDTAAEQRSLSSLMLMHLMIEVMVVGGNR